MQRIKPSLDLNYKNQYSPFYQIPANVCLLNSNSSSPCKLPQFSLESLSSLVQNDIYAHFVLLCLEFSGICDFPIKTWFSPVNLPYVILIIQPVTRTKGKWGTLPSLTELLSVFTICSLCKMCISNLLFGMHLYKPNMPKQFIQFCFFEIKI